MSSSEQPLSPWADRSRHGHGDALCGPGCRYRGMYEATQKSLEEMGANHRKALEIHKNLRDGLISMAKRLFRGDVTEVERGGRKFSDADDEALLMYLEGFIGAVVNKRRADWADMESLRAALAAKGYELPDSHDISAWVAALSAQGETTPGFPASDTLMGVPLQNLDQELADLLKAEGMSATVQPGEKPQDPPEDTPGLHDLFPSGEELPESETPPAGEQSQTEPSTDPTSPNTTEAASAAEDAASIDTGPVDTGSVDVTAAQTSSGGGGVVEDDLAALLAAEADEGPGAVDPAGDDPDLDALFGEEDDLDFDDELGPGGGSDLSVYTDSSQDVPGDSEGGQFAGEIEPETFDTTPEIPAKPEKMAGEGESQTNSPSTNPSTNPSTSNGEAQLADLFSPEAVASEAAPGGDEPPVEDGRAPGLEELFGELPAMTPATDADLASLFGDPGNNGDPSGDLGVDLNGDGRNGEQQNEVAAASPTLNPPKPAFLTPEQAGGTRLRPELVPGAGHPQKPGQRESKKPAERTKPKEKAQRPERIRFDVPEVSDSVTASESLSPELTQVLVSAVEEPRPMFMADLAKLAGDRSIAEAWETEMRSVNNPPVRFLSARSHHRDRGSLILPHRMRIDPTPEFSKSFWGQALASGHRGNVLYEIAVLLGVLGEYVVSCEFGDELVVLRANLPQGLTGIVVVGGDDLGAGGQTREALVTAVGTLIGERLATVMVLSVRNGRDSQLADLIAHEGSERGWRPTMPVAVDLAWKYATGRGSTAKVAIGG